MPLSSVQAACDAEILRAAAAALSLGPEVGVRDAIFAYVLLSSCQGCVVAWPEAVDAAAMVGTSMQSALFAP